MKLFQLIFWHAVYMQEITSTKLSRLRSEEEAFEYAEFWILTNPDDIVMLVEVELDICKHCEQPIQEYPGWIVHQWIHIQSRRYMCDFPNMTQAEPKESKKGASCAEYDSCVLDGDCPIFENCYLIGKERE